MIGTTAKQIFSLKRSLADQYIFFRQIFLYPIGNKGQNARLCARLTGYNIDIRPESGYYGEEEPKAAEAEKTADTAAE